MNELSGFGTGFDSRRRALFEELLQRELAETTSVSTIAPRPTGDMARLSFAQERLWFMQLLLPGNPFYNMPIPWRLSGRLDVGALRKCLDALVARHETLRTTFRAQGDGAVQVIGAPRPVKFVVVDLSGLPDEEREADALRLVQEEGRRLFDLAVGPLFRALLVRLGVRGTMVLGLTAWLAAMCVLAVGRPFELVVASLGLNGMYVTGFLIAGQVYVNELAAGDLRASAQGLLSCVCAVGLLAGNLLAGWLRQWAQGDVPATFTVAAAITAVMLVVLVTGFRQTEGAPLGPVAERVNGDSGGG